VRKPHAITKKRLTITPAAATKKLDITPISHWGTTCTLPIMRKPLNIPHQRMVLTNYGGNLSEAKQAGQDFKIGRDFSIGNHHHLLQQIDNFVAASVRGTRYLKVQ
jgi:hypothetical protein